MTSFVLVPGAGGAAWYWHRVVPLLQEVCAAIPVDLPGDDETAGLPEYAQAVVDAIGPRHDVVLVAQSLGGFVAPLVAARAPVAELVLVNAMIPLPGETPGAWWDNTGWAQARIAAATDGGYTPEFDEPVYFLHDVPPAVVQAGAKHQRAEADAVFASVCDVPHWPDVSTHVVAGAGDRFFPVHFQKQLAQERLGIRADVLPGGHLIALSQPESLASYLLKLRSDRR